MMKLRHPEVDAKEVMAFTGLRYALRNDWNRMSGSKKWVCLITYDVEESLNVTFDESPPPTKLSPLVDDDVGEEEAIRKNTKKPKNVNEALKDKSWVVAMQEELNQFVANDVWELVPLPISQSVIGTKWVFRNKLDENGIVSRNKARLVAQGYNQQEGIDYDETYAPVARLESIRILLAIACANDFKLYQMDVKSAFLNGFINEEVYVAQPPRFIDFQKPNYVYKLKKALYGLKQAPKACVGLEDSKPTKNPMSTEIKLTKDDETDSIDTLNIRGRQDFSRDNANNADFSKPDFLLHKAHLSLKLDYLLLWHITQPPHGVAGGGGRLATAPKGRSTFRGAFGLGGSNKGVRLVGAVTATKGRSVGGSHQQPPYGTFSIVAAKGGVCLGLASS
ncbi:retrovirus-related pol polyprotein from transposon TNT 1-94 [Tanacetum coccineum]|uniref:Retrovirus-related pol polyprotein from transposon TNT 1-94 n=1 Tax=Tanacetum coccineum TaxID=301880 RepID=A0ABQ5D240_9ASTR